MGVQLWDCPLAALALGAHMIYVPQTHYVIETLKQKSKDYSNYIMLCRNLNSG